MSRENVEVARRLHDAFNARDVEALIALVRPDAEWVPIMAKLEGSVYRGHGEMRRWMAEIDAHWEEFRTLPEEFRDLGDRVLSLGTWQARSRTGGVALDGQPGAWLAHFDADGLVFRHETFTDPDEAVAEGERNVTNC
jgi:ketosteroid isomerase-like protein